MNRHVCLEAHDYLLAHLTVNSFDICAISNIDLVISILHKIYSMLQSILIHMKKPFFLLNMASAPRVCNELSGH